MKNIGYINKTGCNNRDNWHRDTTFKIVTTAEKSSGFCL